MTTHSKNRLIAQVVMTWYYEHQHSVMHGPFGEVFSPVLMDYAIDVSRVIESLHPSLQRLLMLVYQDGIDVQIACEQCQLTLSRGQFERLESHLGEIFDSMSLARVSDHL